jgi:hypothetical protein
LCGFFAAGSWCLLLQPVGTNSWAIVSLRLSFGWSCFRAPGIGTLLADQNSRIEPIDSAVRRWHEVILGWLRVSAMHTGTVIDTVDISSTVTRLKRLSLALPERAQHQLGPITYSRLMDLSIQRIAVMAHSDVQDELLVASRILENAKVYCRWENEHAIVMRRVAEQRRTRMQTHELLAATFELIHRKSLFAHLRDNHIQGQRREHLIRHFFTRYGYTRGVIIEHGIFLRSSASLACSSYLGTDLLHDAVFQQPLYDYEQMYAAYFNAYCEQLLVPQDAEWSLVARSVAYSLKCDLAVLRRTITGLANRLSVEDARRLDHDAWG